MSLASFVRHYLDLEPLSLEPVHLSQQLEPDTQDTQGIVQGQAKRLVWRLAPRELQ